MMSMLCNCCVRELLILARTWFAFGLPSKTGCDTNRIPICDVFYAKKAFMHYIIYLRVTSGKTLCMRREQRINLSVFHCILI
jgi:hypothetical protein